MNIKKHEIKVAFVFTLMLNSKQQPPWLQMVNVFKVKQFNFFLTFWKGSAKKKSRFFHSTRKKTRFILKHSMSSKDSKQASLSVHMNKPSWTTLFYSDSKSMESSAWSLMQQKYKINYTSIRNFQIPASQHNFSVPIKYGKSSRKMIFIYLPIYSSCIIRCIADDLLSVNYACGGQIVFYSSYSFILWPSLNNTHTANRHSWGHNYSKGHICKDVDFRRLKGMELNSKWSKNENIFLLSIIFQSFWLHQEENLNLYYYGFNSANLW